MKCIKRLLIKLRTIARKTAHRLEVDEEERSDEWLKLSYIMKANNHLPNALADGDLICTRTFR